MQKTLYLPRLGDGVSMISMVLHIFFNEFQPRDTPRMISKADPRNFRVSEVFGRLRGTPRRPPKPTLWEVRVQGFPREHLVFEVSGAYRDQNMCQLCAVQLSATKKVLTSISAWMGALVNYVMANYIAKTK